MRAFLRRHRPSPAMVVAVVALFVAMGGVGYAALGKDSVGSKQVKDNSLKGKDVKDGKLTASDLADDSVGATELADNSVGSLNVIDASLSAADLAAGTLPVVPGAFARVDTTGVLFGDPNETSGIDAADVQHDAAATATTTGPGVYCFGGLDFVPRSVIVVPDSAGDIDTNVIASGAVQRTDPAVVGLNNCNADHQQARVSMTAVDQTNAPTLTNHRFFVWFLR